MDDDGFAEAIAGLVERHPVLYYRMKLEDSHIPCHVVKRDFFGDTFLEVFWQYNNALFDSVRLMIRYEKSLKAWEEIVVEVDDKVMRGTLVMDYVHPVFMVACDLPNVFKDQLVRGCVKLATIAKGDYSYLRDGRPRWFDAMKDACADTSLGVQLCDTVNGDLFEGADAVHFRELHGSGMHDLSQSLVSGLEQTVSVTDCIAMQTYIGAFDLGKELEILDRQRRRIQKAYLLFGDYGDALYEGDLAIRTVDCCRRLEWITLGRGSWKRTSALIGTTIWRLRGAYFRPSASVRSPSAMRALIPSST